MSAESEPQRRPSRRFIAATLMTCAAGAIGCGAPADDEPRPLGTLQSLLSPAERLARATVIRDTAAARGLTNGLLLAGIADAETQMSHCHSELTWACQGPPSPSCGGGPVVAGAGDGPCSLQQGGLGMFQFDAGTFADTLAREGDRILTLEGNIEAGVDFVIDMVKKSTYISGVSTDQQALDWMNAVRTTDGTWDTWIKTVTHYYNGCVPGSCSVYNQRYNSYSSHGTGLLDEMGHDFWYGQTPSCTAISPIGSIIDEKDDCFQSFGPSQYWRSEAIGYESSLLWSNVFEATAPSNWARWNLNLEQAGDFDVEVYVEPGFAVYDNVRYEIRANGADSVVYLDQSAAAGWTPLGSFFFAAGASQFVTVLDDVPAPVAPDQRFVADAIRLTPAASGAGGAGGSGGTGTGGVGAGGSGVGGTGAAGSAGSSGTGTGVGGTDTGGTAGEAGGAGWPPGTGGAGAGLGGNPSTGGSASAAPPRGRPTSDSGCACTTTAPRHGYGGWALLLGAIGMTARRRRRDG